MSPDTMALAQASLEPGWYINWSFLGIWLMAIGAGLSLGVLGYIAFHTWREGVSNDDQ